MLDENHQMCVSVRVMIDGRCRLNHGLVAPLPSTVSAMHSSDSRRCQPDALAALVVCVRRLFVRMEGGQRHDIQYSSTGGGGGLERGGSGAANAGLIGISARAPLQSVCSAW